MAKQNLVLGLVLGGCLAAVACSSSSDDSSNSAGGTGGTHSVAGSSTGGAGGSAGKANGGTSSGGSDSSAGTGGSVASAGASEGGAAGAPSSGEAGTGGEAGAPVVPPPPPPPLDPWTVVVTSAAPTTFNHVLVTGTDYATKGEVASVKLSPATLEDSTSYPDSKGDVTAVGSGGLGFVLQRTEGKVNLVEGSKIKTTFDMASTGTGIAPDLAHKAYVPSYNYNFISVLDLDAGTVTGRVDISQFNDPNDSDGSVNTTAAMYDASKKLAYFVLSRIDLGSYDASFHLPCSATKALVIALDATTDTIVDLNGAGAGKGIELYLANPASAELSPDGKTITVLDYGCFAGDLSKQGVELVHLDTASRTIAYAPTDSNTPADLLLLTGQPSLLHVFLPDFSDVWTKLDLTTGIVGAGLSNVPLGAATDGANIYGVTIAYPSQAASVVKYDVATDATTTVAASPWVGQYSSAATVALVK